MKLASYIVDGAEAFGVVRDDGVITMNNRFGGHAANLREALDGDLLAADRGGGADREHRPQAFRHQIPAGHSQPGQDRLRRHQLPLACEPKPAARSRSSRACSCGCRYAGRPRRRDDPADGIDQFRFRGRACGRDRPRRAAYPKSSARSSMWPATPASSTAAYATTRNSQSPRARIFPAPARSGRGW